MYKCLFLLLVFQVSCATEETTPYDNNSFYTVQPPRTDRSPSAERAGKENSAFFNKVCTKSGKEWSCHYE